MHVSDSSLVFQAQDDQRTCFGSPTNCNTLKYSTSSVESAHLLVPVPFQIHTAWLAAPAFLDYLTNSEKVLRACRLTKLEIFDFGAVARWSTNKVCDDGNWALEMCASFNCILVCERAVQIVLQNWTYKCLSCDILWASIEQKKATNTSNQKNSNIPVTKIAHIPQITMHWLHCVQGASIISLVKVVLVV